MEIGVGVIGCNISVVVIRKMKVSLCDIDMKVGEDVCSTTDDIEGEMKMDVIVGELVISRTVVGKNEEKIGVGVETGRDEDTL